MSAPADCRLVGRWRIVEADLWDRDHLDLCGPATITINGDGRGEIAFGALEAVLEIAYGRTSIDFTWNGCDEGDQVSGEGCAELLDDGSIEIEFAYHNGDEAVLKAKRETFSASASARTFLPARLFRASFPPAHGRRRKVSAPGRWSLASWRRPSNFQASNWRRPAGRRADLTTRTNRRAPGARVDRTLRL